MKYAIGVTWSSSKGFKFSDEVARISGAELKIVGADFPKKQWGYRKYFRVWPLYCLVSLRLVLECWRVDRVICWQQAYGVALGFALRLLEVVGIVPKAKVDVLTFILTPAKRQGFWLKMLNFSLSAKAVSRIVVFNVAEYECYRGLFPNIKDKFACTLYSAADVPDVFKESVANEGFFLAVGRSNRDHEFLRDFFAAHRQWKCVVLTDQEIESHSENFVLIDGIYGDAYFDYLKRCKAVIIPFYDSTISAGQLVYLQSVQLGKPVLVSTSRCLEGYLLPGETGIYFDKTDTDLQRAIAHIENPENYNSMCQSCRGDYAKRFGFTKLAADYVEIVNGASMLS
jgi:glycosyltransferase involved in cell wall biosynthesis